MRNRQAVAFPELRKDAKYVIILYLHSITDTQDGNASFLNKFPDFLGHVWRSLLVNTARSSAENDCSKLVLGQLFRCDQTAIELTVNMHFTHTTGNQMRILRPKIQNRNLWTEVYRTGGRSKKSE
jgi:hypothetical protein